MGPGQVRLLSIGCDTRYSENTQIGLAGRNESGDLIRHGPQDTSWGERYFHMRDPDGHELSFAPAVRMNFKKGNVYGRYGGDAEHG